MGSIFETMGTKPLLIFTMPAEKRERKAPEKLVYDAPEPKAKKPKAAKKVAGAKKEKKAKKGYKGAMGAYMFFVQENRSEVTTNNPDASFGEIGKLLGAEWRECSAKDKKKFEAMGAKDKIRAAKDKAAWEKTQ